MRAPPAGGRWQTLKLLVPLRASGGIGWLLRSRFACRFCLAAKDSFNYIAEYSQSSRDNVCGAGEQVEAFRFGRRFYNRLGGFARVMRMHYQYPPGQTFVVDSVFAMGLRGRDE